MQHPFHALLIGWLVALGMAACLHQPHTFTPSAGGTAVHAEESPTQAALSAQPADTLPGAPVAQINRPRAAEDNTEYGFERPVGWENSSEPQRSAKQNEPEQQDTKAVSNQSVRADEMIQSSDHPLLEGLEIERKYFPLVLNQGGNQKYETRTGTVSFEDDSQRSASGERFNPEELVAAHARYPFGTIVRCTNLSNNKSVRVQVIDRGPFVNGRILDLSEAAGSRIGLLRKGVTRCKVEVLAYPRK